MTKNHRSRRRSVAAVTSKRSHPDAAIFALVRQHNILRDLARKAHNRLGRDTNKLPEDLREPGAWTIALSKLDAYRRSTEEHAALVHKHDPMPRWERAVHRCMRRLVRTAHVEAFAMWRKARDTHRDSGLRQQRDAWARLAAHAERVREKLLAIPAKTAKGLRAKWVAAETPRERMALVNELFAVAPDILPKDAVAATINSQNEGR